MRPPIDSIIAPPFPRGATWANSPALEMQALRGRVVLIEFWDFCRPNSLRTLPYLQAWHRRYGGDGSFVVVSVQRCPSAPPSLPIAIAARVLPITNPAL